MNVKKWMGTAVASLLLVTSLSTANVVSAEGTRTIEDESIYDVLVDRFFNGSGLNDEGVNTKDITAFNGGDFAGLVSKKAFIEKMGFTIVSIGTVFATEKYDGSMPISYDKLEPHFGTEEEFTNLIDSYAKSNMKVMVDFPLNNLSPNHEWLKANQKDDWVSSKENGQVQLDLSNEVIQEKLKAELVKFIAKNDVSIRFTNIESADKAFLNELIAEIKAIHNDAYVISNAPSEADFDAKYDANMIETQRNLFKTVDQDSSAILSHMDVTPSTQVMIDSIWSDRFILYGEQEGMYPPTRAKMGVAATLLLPGLPVVQYGTEIAMNGTAGAEAHQLYNFKTDTELMDLIGNIQTLRNSSEALRKGEFKLVKNEQGYIAYTRQSADEQWLVVINNRSITEKAVLTEEMIGQNKKLVAILDTETIRADKNGNYTAVLDREKVEIYHIKEDTGINMSYIVALGIVYLLFTWFVIVIVKRGRLSRAAQNSKINK